MIAKTLSLLICTIDFLTSQLQTYQILTNDDQMFILCLSYFVTTVPFIHLSKERVGPGMRKIE